MGIQKKLSVSKESIAMRFFGLIFLTGLFFSCKNNTSQTSQYVDAKNAIHDSIANPGRKKDLKVSAYLIYDDGTQSAFDVLNDKTIALWNAVAGGGDVLKPSNNTKVHFAGDLDSLDIKIKNGQKLIIDTTIRHSNKDVDYTIKNTGCEEVYVTVFKNKKAIYIDTIPFHCGE